MPGQNRPEPWLRGTLTEVAAVPRAVLYALELAGEDLTRFCGNLTDTEINARPYGIAPVAFHIRHIARSVDRLLTYAEGNQLTAEQLTALQTELNTLSTREEVFAELDAALTKGAARIRKLDAATVDQPRAVGKEQLPTTVGGLLIHVADHTQRHVGQAVTTAKTIFAQRAPTD